MARRPRRHPILWTAVAMIIAGCAMMEMHRPGPPPAFDHAQHTEAIGLECTHCHAGARAQDRAGMPTLEICRGCHVEEDEAELPLAYRLETVLGDAPRRWETFPRQLAAELRFSHGVHAGGDVPCVDCHGDVGSTIRQRSPRRLGKPDCLSCHEGAGVRESCSTCHLEIDELWRPESHDLAWIVRHGQTIRSGMVEGFTDRCSFCHQESTCVDCHMAEPPADHTHFWRQRGHSIEARIDRTRCETCHRSDFCDRCHAETAPINHRGAWGSPLNQHCLSCHLLGQRECGLCHPPGAPSHALATPLPPGHLPSFNCRACHGVTQPLPHVDGGDECTACHL